MPKPTSFRICTEPKGPGQGHWFWVRVYDSLEEMREAAHRYHPWETRASMSNAGAVCQPIDKRERYEGGKWINILPNNKCSGVIRLVRPFTYEHVAHEIVHASLAIYRQVVKERANFGTNCSPAEENLAYIHGELFDDFVAWVTN